jgi:hypothetical protein
MDDAAVIDPVRVAPDHALHNSDALAFVVQFDDVGVQPYPQLTADQSRGDR